MLGEKLVPSRSLLVDRWATQTQVAVYPVVFDDVRHHGRPVLAHRFHTFQTFDVLSAQSPSYPYEDVVARLQLIEPKVLVGISSGL